MADALFAGVLDFTAVHLSVTSVTIKVPSQGPAAVLHRLTRWTFKCFSVPCPFVSLQLIFVNLLVCPSLWNCCFLHRTCSESRQSVFQQMGEGSSPPALDSLRLLSEGSQFSSGALPLIGYPCFGPNPCTNDSVN